MDFVCLECGRVFEEPNHWEERHGLDCGPFEHWSGCPSCGGSYAETYYCDCCGYAITDSYIKTEDGNRYCSDCFSTYEIGEE